VGATGALLTLAQPTLAWADGEAPEDAVAADAPAEQPAEQPAAEPAPSPEMSALEIQILALVNGARSARDIAPLVWDATMSEVAREHAAEMMRRGVVSHTGADGSSPVVRLRRAGVKFQFGSENIWTYWGGVPAQGPSTMHAAMMAEPWAPGLWNHIGNLLYTGYRRIGVGIVVASSGVQYLSETFAD
jgi:uncharacterized protein YkwD